MGSWKEDRLQLVLRASREGIWDWDLVEGSIYYSRRVYRFMGYRKEDMPNLFEERREHMDEASVAAVDEALRRVVQEGEDLFAVEPRVKTKRGDWKSFRVRGTPVRDELGKVIRIAGSLIDISKRKEAERMLEEERHLIKTLLDNIPMNVYFKDQESKFVMANLPTAQKMGLDSPEKLVGRSDADFFSRAHANHARRVETEIMASLRGVEDLTEHEKWDQREDTWVKSTKHAWLGSDDKVRGTFGVTIDISELMRTRAAQEQVTTQLNAQNQLIEEERERLRLVIDSVPLHVYFKNLDHEFVIANRAIAKWFGLERPDELYDKSDRDIFSNVHWQQAEADEKRIMETGEAIVGSIERETWAGKKDTWVMTSKYPWRDSEGAIVGTFGVSSDISDLMVAQANLRKLAGTYEKKNREMAEELELAREVQQALLPDDFPEICGGGVSLQFYRRYEPARILTGEFFEVVPLGPDKVGFLMGEVFDKGVRSALIVSMLRGLIEKEFGSAGDAGAFLTGLNLGLSHLLVDSGHEVRATAFYGVVDLSEATIQLSVAGHVNPIAVFDDGVRQLVPPENACGPALGLAESTTYGAVTAPVKGLRRMFCFTQGVKEARNQDGVEFGVTRMLGEIERGGEMEKVMERLSGAVREFCGDEVFRNAICLLGWEVTR
ncbi:MAG: sigma-B regulation protein RsbU (phosphoserine phosphatase) [Akkermansiaceae bacterium]|jgi:sigma-B regulation protein RsbU (phosphoserine phosphatase)